MTDPDLERLLELENEKIYHLLETRLSKEYEQLKSKLNEKLDDSQIYIEQIKQLKENQVKLLNIEENHCESIDKRDKEIQSLKSENKELLEQNVKLILGYKDLKSKNEKYQKVIDEIKNRIKKIEDEYPYSNNCKPSDTNSDYILLKSILSEIEKE